MTVLVGRPASNWLCSSNATYFSLLPRIRGRKAPINPEIRRYHGHRPLVEGADRSIGTYASGFSCLATVRSRTDQFQQKRTYRQSSVREDQVKQASIVKPVPVPAKSSSGTAKELVTDDAQKVSDKQQSLTDWKIIKRLVGNIWPKGEWEIKTRVIGALGLLVAGKVSTFRAGGDGFLGSIHIMISVRSDP